MRRILATLGLAVCVVALSHRALPCDAFAQALPQAEAPAAPAPASPSLTELRAAPSPEACSASEPSPISIGTGREARTALIITNQRYPGGAVGPLTATHADGAAMCRALVALGFHVVHVKDANRAAFDSAVRGYILRLSRLRETAPKDATLASFLYFSGHGAAADEGGANYLVPSDEKMEVRDDLVRDGVNLDDLVRQVRDTSRTFGVAANFIVVDACRNLAFPMSTRGGTRGFKPIGEQSGLMIAFSTSPGLTAVDARHYSTALAEELQVPNRPAYLAFRAVRRRVLDATSYRQFPWMHDGLLDTFYFKGDGQNPSFALAPSPEARAGKVRFDDDRIVIRDCDACPPLRIIVPAAPPPGSKRPELASFAMGETEVTFEQWEMCVKDGGCQGVMPEDGGFPRGKHPVINVSWRQAQLYLEWLGRKSAGRTYRLPTEAEWEYAARGDRDTRYIHGDDPAGLCKFANGNRLHLLEPVPCNTGRDRGTEAVRRYEANALGLYDMSGNVWEWVDACHAGGKSVAGPGDGCDRVLKGGSWKSGLSQLHVTARRRAPPDYASDTIGFRVARTN